MGKIGENPGNAWTADTAAGFTDALGGRWWTKNHTMIRKPSVQSGVTANPQFFNPAAEWDTLGYNQFDHLGWHVCSCTPNSINEAPKQHSAFFFPNPVNGESFTVKATAIIQSVVLTNTMGQVVLQEQNSQPRGDMKIQTQNISKGVYFVRITLEDNSNITKKLIIK
jgi:hypothetical protein